MSWSGSRFAAAAGWWLALAALPVAAEPVGMTYAGLEAADRAIFAQLDTNRDGKLTAAEWDADPKFSPETKARFHYGLHKVAEYDDNHDGVNTLPEMLAHDKALFARMDANHDGVVTADEQAAFDASLARR